MSEEQVYSARHWAAKAAASAQDAAQSAQNSRGLAIGQLVWSQSSLAKDNPGCLPAWTGEYYPNAAALYPDFYAWVKSHPELCKTKTQYDEALSAYGECPYYVADEVAGSLRLPLLKNYIKAANTAEGITQKKAGLPNIDSDTNWVNATGGTETAATNTNILSDKGVFGGTNSQGGHGIKGNDYSINWRRFDASKSNAIYGASDTVTPAHTTLYPWVCAYNAAVPASTVQAAEFQQALTGKANADLSNCPTEYDYVVDSGVLEDGSWWRRHKNGWLEQGNSSPTGDQGFTLNKTINFPKPFADNTYMLVGPGFYVANAGAQNITRTATGFTTSSVQNLTGCAYWYACGQGAEEE